MEQDRSNRTQLVVIRHGETEWNVRGIWQGQQNSPLTDQGMRQAKAVAERLRKFPVAAVYSSDLGRCIQSAQPTVDALSLKLSLDERLRERSFGVLEGMDKQESQRRYPGIWEELGRKDIDFAPEGGESLRQKQTRFEAVFLDLAKRHAGQCIAVFTHGGGVDALVRMVLNLSLSAERKYTLWNSALNVVTWEEQLWTLDTLGDVAHLHGMQSAFRAR